MANDNGIVYLVGAGPGDPGLITVRGVDCLRRADVVVYDNLANPDLLRYAPHDAEVIYAGKMADQHTKTQDEINEILVEKARQGLTVVRLKGGDPFLFGRGGEEAGQLKENGIRWEVVPGVTSAIAVPAYAGIPVTHRSVNGSLHIVTGHENRDGLGADIDWSVLAKSQGTLVFLMGVKNLPMISEELMKHGMPGDMPVAMVQWGTLAEQKTVVSTLEHMVADVSAAGIKPPAVGIVGNVVKLREELAWFEKRPLFGTRVAVTRPAEENDTLAAHLQALGADVVRTPTLQVVPLELSSEGRDQLQAMGRGAFDWIVITSGNGARLFCDLLLKFGKDARWLAGCKVAAIGERTADALRDRGLIADLVATDARQEGLLKELLAVDPRRVLIARALQARPVLEESLSAAGVEVQILPLYQTIPDTVGIGRLKNWLKRGKLHVVTFTSARTFEAFAEALDEPPRDALSGVAAAVIGPITKAAVEGAGVPVAVVSPIATMEALAESILAQRQSRG